MTNSLEPSEIPLASGQDPDETSPALVVSNAPEALDYVTQPFNLYKCEIPNIVLSTHELEDED
ncbi:MAG TPA: hypothetical protein PKA27_10845 [Fimbriimonadaceae bacterium]|nr:hypothetical protein [Fimbriimonadaceae bacterium]